MTHGKNIHCKEMLIKKIKIRAYNIFCYMFVSETDKYKRLLRYVYVDDIFINEELVKTGYANVASYPPDIKYQDKFNDAEKQAREASLGLWESCQEDI